MSRPYFETKIVKVVKVKKEEDKCIHVGMAYAYNKTGDTIECANCGENFILEGKEKPKGNWVNGENLDKIKFPVPCSYQYFGKTRYAILSKGAEFDGPTKYTYSLIDIKKQDNLSESFEEYDLKEMILNHDIHILKGKIILYEEE